MGRQNIIVKEDKPPNPLTPLFGFIVFLIVGGLAYLASPSVVHWLTTSNIKLGGLIQVLPIEFPKGWSAVANNITVAVVMFFVFFAIAMTVVMFLMKPPGKDELSLDQLRKEAKKKQQYR